VSYHICKNTYPFARIFNAQFESHFYRGEKRIERSQEYDLVIGNPPYGKFTGYYSGPNRERRKVASEKLFKGATYDQYFMWAGIKLLKPGGLCIMIVPSDFLQNASSYERVKRDIYEMADLVDAYRMPSGLFDFTQITTDILVFKKR
jgi:type I restriction-modification system DNA methylase subunit